MSIFALENIDEVKNGACSFFKLSYNGRCFYDEFCEEIGNNAIEKKQLNIIRTYMNLMAETNLQLPSVKFNSIKQGNKVIAYEFKSKDLRIYVVKQDPNIFVILGGHKKNQNKDIDYLKKHILSDEFYQYIQDSSNLPTSKK